MENYCKHVDKLKLKSASPCYSHTQGQLAATTRLYCDLFVFSFQKNLAIRVDYNDLCWTRTLSGFGEQSLLINS